MEIKKILDTKHTKNWYYAHNGKLHLFNRVAVVIRVMLDQEEILDPLDRRWVHFSIQASKGVHEEDSPHKRILFSSRQTHSLKD